VVGSRIGPYEVLEKLGAGGMGEVYLARDTRLRRKVALKSITASRGTAGPDSHRRVLHEARAAANLNHPGIAAVYDVIEADGRAHIVMEYVRGESLAGLLRRGPVPVPRAVEIGRELAEAVGAAHRAGVIHRDLKPANVVLTEEGHAKVLDFGIAKTFVFDSQADTDTTTFGVSLLTPEEGGRLAGTPAYMAPEVLRGHPATLQSDLYSLGVIFFEMLTGRRPFSGVSFEDLRGAVLNGPSPRAHEWNPDVPAALGELVAKTMARVTRERLPSAQALLEGIARVVDGRRGVRLDRPRRAAFGSSVILATAVSAWLIGRSPAHPSGTTSAPPVIAVLPLAHGPSDPELEALEAGVAATLITSLSRVGGLSVASRFATLPYRSGDRTPKKVAEDLGAGLLVDGHIQRSGHKVRVLLNLVKPDSQLVVWGASYDGEVGDMLEFQERVADAAATALAIRLTAQDRARLRTPLTANQDALIDFARARALLDRQDVPGNLEKAIGHFEAATAKDPGFTAAHAGIGEAYRLLHRQTKRPEALDRARAAAAVASRLDPLDLSVRFTAALISQATGDNAAAVGTLREIAATDPWNALVRHTLGNLLSDLGRNDEAIEQLTQAVSLRPGHWIIHNDLGAALYAAGRYREAIPVLQRAIRLQPDNAWSQQVLGTVYHAMGATTEAERHYRQAIELAQDAMAYTGLGNLYYEHGKFEGAADAFREAAKREPNEPTKHRNLGDTYRRLGREAHARRAYARAVALGRDQLSLNPGDPMALARLAVYEAKLGQASEAKRHAQRALEVAPTSGGVLYRNAVVHALVGETKTALDFLESAIREGYSGSFAAKDDDLNTLRLAPRYQRLVGSKDTPVTN
jgi:serine/threonine protein kinase/tetratricopeptide (TPR) repeat protein